jgi:hypothetical protein
MKKLISLGMLAVISSITLASTAFAEETEQQSLPEIATITEETTAATLRPIRPDENEIGDSDEADTDGMTMFEIPKGNATLIEEAFGFDIVKGLGRQFMTVQTRGGHTFYIVIETGEETQNVYFLNAVDDWDLLAFAENFPADFLEVMYDERVRNHEKYLSALENQGVEVDESEIEIVSPLVKPEPEEIEIVEESKGMSFNTIISIVIIAIIAAVAVVMFIKKRKSGGSANYPSDSAADSDEDDYDD